MKLNPKQNTLILGRTTCFISCIARLITPAWDGKIVHHRLSAASGDNFESKNAATYI